MNPDLAAAFAGEIPKNYDRYLGPVLFEPFADDMAARLKGKGIANVLEIASGTGILTRRLRDILEPASQLVATDLNGEMLNYARTKFQSGENVKWQEADASALPFADQSFDRVVSQFGLMFVPDKDLANRESFRVLRPGGIYLFSVWDSLADNGIARIAHETISSFFDRDPPRFYEIPFGYHDQDVTRRSLQSAGFSEIEVATLTLPCQSPSAAELAIGLIRGNPVLLMIEERGADVAAIINGVARAVAQNFGDRPVTTTMRAQVWQGVRK